MPGKDKRWQRAKGTFDAKTAGNPAVRALFQCRFAFKKEKAMNTRSHINAALVRSIAKSRRLLGERCFLALLNAKHESSASTAAIIRTVLPHRRTKLTIKALVQTSRQIIANLKLGKEAKSPLRFEVIRRRCAYFQAVLLGQISAPALPWSSQAYQLPSGTPQQRLAALRNKQEAERIKRMCERLKDFLACKRTNEETVQRLLPGAGFADITARAWGETEWVRYTRRLSYTKRFACFRVTIPHDYEKTVIATGLQFVGGMLTLAALPEPSNRAGEQIWKAKWIRKGRGFSFILHEGYIICTKEEYAHGKTVSLARRVLTQREFEKKLQQREGALRQLLTSNTYQGFATIKVSIADSIAAGNCESGTHAFRDKYFPGRESATLAEILSRDFGGETRRLAISACIHAIRKDVRRSPASRAAYLSVSAQQKDMEPGR